VKIEVRYFASLAELAGTSSETLDVERACDVRTVWGAIVARHPSLGSLSYRPLVACDMAYSDWDAPIADVREIAFLPPVSGG